MLVDVQAGFLGHVQASRYFSLTTMTREQVETLEQFLRNSLAIL